MIDFVAFVIFGAGVLTGWVLRVVYSVMTNQCHDDDHTAERGW